MSPIVIGGLDIQTIRSFLDALVQQDKATNIYQLHLTLLTEARNQDDERELSPPTRPRKLLTTNIGPIDHKYKGKTATKVKQEFKKELKKEIKEVSFFPP